MGFVQSRMEERSILAQPIDSVPEAAAGNGLQPVGLPEFVTPDWLKDNHHLMRADLRKLASALAEEYSDWPAAVDGSDEAAFWRAVHSLAQRWAWFLWLFEERILELFGRVKGRKKLLGRLVLKSAAERAKALRPAAPGVSEEYILDHLETLWEEGQRVLVAQTVWVLWCSGGPESAYMMSSWLEEPEIERLVGHAVHRSRFRGLGERDDLVDRLKREAGGPHLERLAARADKECAMLRKDIADAYGRLKTHITEHDDDRPATDLLSYMVLEMAALGDELDEIETARNLALARSRHAALRTLLEGAAEAAGQTALAEEAGALTGRIEALLPDTALPLCIPDPEWEKCLEQAERFRSAIVEPGAHELALREASRRYAENPSAENLEALHTAASAEREHPRSLEPAKKALDEVTACLGDLVQQFGSMAKRDDGEEEEVDGREAFGGRKRDRDRALRAEIDELKAANRTAEERIAALKQALADAGEENDGLRHEKHRLQQRLAAIGGAGAPSPAEDETVSALESYADLPSWAERHFQGRVVLAGRALRALKSAGFEDVGLVGRAIEVLAGSYWRMKTGGGGKALRDAFEEELRELRLQETKSISRDRQGKARDDFSIDWDGRRLMLDRHLKNNAKTRDPRQCLRVYFTWDDTTRQVVIGHLPGHMRT
ncbi:MAG: hypothetical protein OXO52_08590 [Rhodospirillales bacterium]|nr:hypothetical protein [Rhodospirillales bacterium]